MLQIHRYFILKRDCAAQNRKMASSRADKQQEAQKAWIIFSRNLATNIASSKGNPRSQVLLGSGVLQLPTYVASYTRRNY